MADIFIAGTDTGVGKTWVTAAVIRSFSIQGVCARALKPVACGLDGEGKNEDIESLLSAQSLTDANDINLYRFALPAAPSQAAAAEGRVIDADKLVQWCNEQVSDVETCLIEGVGGLMTPLTDTWLVSDWIEAMPDCELWLVVGCRLGAINQTLLTLAKLKQMNRSPARIFFNATTDEQNAWIQPVMDAVVPFIENDCHATGVRYLESVTL